MRLLIKNAAVYGDGKQSKKDIFIDQGVIVEVEDNIDINIPEVLDASGLCVLPGAIDLCCNICEPGYEIKEDISSVSKSAAKGGFTSITCQPDTKPVVDDKTVVCYIVTNSLKRSLVNVHVYGSITKLCQGLEIAEIGEMKKAGIIAVSDGKNSVADANLMRNILLYSKMFDMPVITYCEDKSLSGYGVMNMGAYSAQIGLHGVPREAEEVMVARDLILARHTKAKLHITNVSAKGSVELIRRAKKDGVNVTCDTCPHYFTLSALEVDSYNTLAKIKPPLRESEDIDSLLEGIADGTIDAISSGHSPETAESKKLEFDSASWGISSLETAFALSYTALVEKNIITMPELVKKMSLNPAKILGLNSKGAIAPGYDADLILVDTENKYEINASEFASKAKYSPHNGTMVSGKIMYTMVEGNIIYVNI